MALQTALSLESQHIVAFCHSLRPLQNSSESALEHSRQRSRSSLSTLSLFVIPSDPSKTRARALWSTPDSALARVSAHCRLLSFPPDPSKTRARVLWSTPDSALARVSAQCHSGHFPRPLQNSSESALECSGPLRTELSLESQHDWSLRLCPTPFRNSSENALWHSRHRMLESQQGVTFRYFPRHLQNLSDNTLEQARRSSDRLQFQPGSIFLLSSRPLLNSLEHSRESSRLHFSQCFFHTPIHNSGESTVDHPRMQ